VTIPSKAREQRRNALDFLTWEDINSNFNSAAMSRYSRVDSDLDRTI